MTHQSTISSQAQTSLGLSSWPASFERWFRDISLLASVLVKGLAPSLGSRRSARWIACVACLALAVLMVSCSATRPPFRTQLGDVVVFAESYEIAKATAERAQQLIGRIHAELDWGQVPAELWVVEKLNRPVFSGVEPFYAAHTDGRRIYIRSEGPSDLPNDTVLAHELVHVLISSSISAELPWALEEAVCTVISHSVSTSDRRRGEKAWLLLAARLPATGSAARLILEYTPWDAREVAVRLATLTIDLGPIDDDLGTLDPAGALVELKQPTAEVPNRVMRGQAFFVVNRIAQELGLRTVVEEITKLAESEEPAWDEALPDLARLPNDTAAWAPIITESLDREALASLLTDGERVANLADDLSFPVHLMRVFRHEYPGETPEAFIASGRPRLRLDGTQLSVDAIDISWLLDRINVAWTAAERP